MARTRAGGERRGADRARSAALAVLAAICAAVSVGIAALARTGAGLCDQRVFAHHPAATPMTGMAGMDMMPAAGADGGICPILLYAAAVAAGLCVLALVALARSRVRLQTVLTATARVVTGAKLGPLTALLGLAGALPLVLGTGTEGGSGLATAVAFLGLLGGAFASALALTAIARVVLAFVRRLAVALAAVFRLLAPGADAPWLAASAPVPVHAGAWAARRRPARAPPRRF